MNSDIKKKKCEFCGELVPYYSTIYVAIDKEYHCSCLKCYNGRMAEYSDIDFEHAELDPIILKDFEGVDHKFHFTVRHLVDRIGIEAFEIKEGHRGGYEFSYIGDIDDEIFNLFGKLVERMLSGLHQKHIEWSNTTNSWQITKDDVVRAKIDSDLESDDYYGHPPLIVIDGKEIKWEDFGRMLMTYEGFNFKLEIFDRSDEMP
jgi:hypothetical protein